MPLHDWSRLPEWEGVHQLWISDLYRTLRSRLPTGYRAGLATVPSLTIGGPSTHPDLSVRRQPGLPGPAPEPSLDDLTGFDSEVTVLSIGPTKMVQVFRGNQLVAVLELISPRNKEREQARAATVDRMVGYLALGVHVLFVDVHAAPSTFSLADAIAATLDFPQEHCPSPHAMAYQVRGPVDGGGQALAIRRAPLVIGQPLPTVPLPLGRALRVDVDLESTYMTAAGDYLSWPSGPNGEG
jgi:hypothetical protein